MSTPVPSVGSIVHFHQEGGPYPAIVTAVNADGTLELATFGQNSLYFQHGIAAGDEDAPARDSWTWPPRV